MRLDVYGNIVYDEEFQRKGIPLGGPQLKQTADREIDARRLLRDIEIIPSPMGGGNVTINDQTAPTPDFGSSVPDPGGIKKGLYFVGQDAKALGRRIDYNSARFVKGVADTVLPTQVGEPLSARMDKYLDSRYGNPSGEPHIVKKVGMNTITDASTGVPDALKNLYIPEEIQRSAKFQQPFGADVPKGLNPVEAAKDQSIGDLLTQYGGDVPKDVAKAAGFKGSDQFLNILSGRKNELNEIGIKTDGMESEQITEAWRGMKDTLNRLPATSRSKALKKTKAMIEKKMAGDEGYKNLSSMEMLEIATAKQTSEDAEERFSKYSWFKDPKTAVRTLLNKQMNGEKLTRAQSEFMLFNDAQAKVDSGEIGTETYSKMFRKNGSFNIGKYKLELAKKAEKEVKANNDQIKLKRNYDRQRAIFGSQVDQLKLLETSNNAVAKANGKAAFDSISDEKIKSAYQKLARFSSKTTEEANEEYKNAMALILKNGGSFDPEIIYYYKSRM